MAVDTQFNKYFIGRVIQREYEQQFDFEFIPIYRTDTDKDGNVINRYIIGYERNIVTAKVVEQSFRFNGLTRELAFKTHNITVADLDNKEYTFPLRASITDGSTGSKVMITEEVSVQRTPVSPRMWELVVTRRGFRYYVNGSHLTLINEPLWILDYV